MTKSEAAAIREACSRALPRLLKLRGILSRLVLNAAEEDAAFELLDTAFEEFERVSSMAKAELEPGSEPTIYAREPPSGRKKKS